MTDFLLYTKMHKNPIKARFIIAYPKSSIKHLARTIAAIFRLFFRQIQEYNDTCRFFKVLKALTFFGKYRKINQ